MFNFRKLLLLLLVGVFAVGFTACPQEQAEEDVEVTVEQKGQLDQPSEDDPDSNVDVKVKQKDDGSDNSGEADVDLEVDVPDDVEFDTEIKPDDQ